MKKLLLFSLLIALLAVGGWFGWRHFRTETITVSGVVQAQEMKGSSAVGGRVATVAVQEGDTVKTGDLLVALDASEIKARVSQAQALVSQAKANKTRVASGPDSGDINAAREQVTQAEQALKLATSGSAADSARLKAQEQSAHNTLKEAQNAAASAPTMLAEGIISQQRYDQIQADLQAAQSQYAAAQKASSTQSSGSKNEQITMARSRLSAARARYNQLRRGANHSDITAASATIDQAKGELNAIETKLDEANIVAHQDGVVSLLAVHQGDLVLPGQAVVAVTNSQQLWADVYVPEDKLYLVRTGDTAIVRASAFPKKVVFTGTVATIHPKSEFVAGSEASPSESVFRVKLNLSAKDTTGRALLYPGMRIEASFERPGLL